ncbi:ferredoxin-type protein naph [Anaeramoeba ignava]|uniref:Ferredoxin-type protein naph n=1 Tax=Anaeramoeba ignava TaxID=1746090 RepID=A0A9Q0LJ14_ANAIG|nr:ferredoxin-type protein naph [Anaeramoeba ignava]
MYKPFQINKQRKIQYLRHLIQIIVIVFLYSKIFGIKSSSIIVPFLHPTQSLYSTAIGAYDLLEYSLTSGLLPILALGVILTTSLTVGKLFCGWACPLGFVQDLMAYIPIKKRSFGKDMEKNFKELKYAVVVIFLFLAFLFGLSSQDYEKEYKNPFSDCPFNVISPSSTLFAYIPWALFWKPTVFFTSILAWIKIALLLATLISSTIYPRFFCRYVCPLGTILGIPSDYKFLKIKIKSKRTEDINSMLNRVCPMKVSIERNSSYINSSSCIHCGNCIAEMPNDLKQEFF